LFAATRADVEEFFGKEEMERSVTEIKLLGVFGFVQCKTVLAAREIIPSKSFRHIAITSDC
jgi:hypothetical protein